MTDRHSPCDRLTNCHDISLNDIILSVEPRNAGEPMPSSYTLGEHFERFIKEQVDGGRYASASEVIRDALRLLEEEERRRAAALAALRAEIAKGIASGKGRAAREVFERLEAKYTAKVAKRRGT